MNIFVVVSKMRNVDATRRTDRTLLTLFVHQQVTFPLPQHKTFAQRLRTFNERSLFYIDCMCRIGRMNERFFSLEILFYFPIRIFYDDQCMRLCVCIAKNKTAMKCICICATEICEWSVSFVSSLLSHFINRFWPKFLFRFCCISGGERNYIYTHTHTHSHTCIRQQQIRNGIEPEERWAELLFIFNTIYIFSCYLYSFHWMLAPPIHGCFSHHYSLFSCSFLFVGWIHVYGNQ